MDVPIGVRLLQKASGHLCPRLRLNREICYRTSVLTLTFIAYTCYHLSRKPISVVKAVLHRNCSKLTPPSPYDGNSSTWCDWAPFDGSDANAKTLLGIVDSTFLFAYAAAMFASGCIAERVNLRYFLAFGMMLCGVANYMFGVAQTYDVHALSYFIAVQIFGGVVQTTGWPGVLAVVGKWFGRRKRGLIFGVWNSHTSVGNILGTLVAAAYVEHNWGDSFIMPGIIIAVGGLLVFLFLVANPADVNIQPTSIDADVKNAKKLENRVANVQDSGYAPIQSDDSDEEPSPSSLTARYHRMQSSLVDPVDVLKEEDVHHRKHTERSHLFSSKRREERAIGFLSACRIPGVVEFSLSLFFSKLVSYTFMYWLPLYLNASTKMGASSSADYSTVFDIGGIVGAIAAGAISDYSGKSAFTCVIMLMAAAPMMFIYQHFCTVSFTINIVLLMIVGVLVNGPYALITTAVSAELGTHSSIRGSAKALATVSAIIDGTGSIGAAVGPLLAGVVSAYGWHLVFYMLITSDVIALILLLRLARCELYNEPPRAPIRIE